jgi:two-component sensor histidine kinase
MSKQEKKQLILENLIYAIIWLIVFIDPVLRLNNQGVRNWEMVTGIWRAALPFFILFLINNYVLIPFFLIRKKSWFYALFAFVCFLLFAAEPFVLSDGRNNMHRYNAGTFMEQRSFPPRNDHLSPPPGRFGQMPVPDGVRPFAPRNGMTPIMVNRMINRLLIAVLMLGFNVAVKFLFKSMRDDRRLRELEKHTLETELNYLKIQINPHFFMNTLNNIHALIDMDTEKAKETVIELAKIMRYVLYDADRPQVSLKQEIQFIVNYVALMRIRYTEEIDIRLQLPSKAPDAKIPPLLFFMLIENAFKHGISYRHDSFIHIILSIETDRLHCRVENSLPPGAVFHPLGVGMENMCKRLELLYAGRYTLDVQPGNETYKVTLIIPLES